MRSRLTAFEGARTMGRKHIEAFARFFPVAPAVFLPSEKESHNLD